MDQGDGTTKNVPCNEHSACMKAADGDRKGGSECGIRICNQKYMFMRADNTYDGKIKFVTLTGGGGGASRIWMLPPLLLLDECWYA